MILTLDEAKAVLRVDGEGYDAIVTALLPGIDAYLEAVTGKRWGEQTPPHPLAREAAVMLLVQRFETPSGEQDSNRYRAPLQFGLNNYITQLQIIAMKEDGAIERGGA